MSGLATVVAISWAALSTASLGSSGCKSFISLSILFVSSLSLLVACTVVFQLLGLLADAVYECLGVNNVAGDPRIGEYLGGKLCKFIRDAFEYSMLVLFLCDSDSSCCQLLFLVAKSS